MKAPDPTLEQLDEAVALLARVERWFGRSTYENGYARLLRQRCETMAADRAHGTPERLTR
jgi:hypothetical protein